MSKKEFMAFAIDVNPKAEPFTIERVNGGSIEKRNFDDFYTISLREKGIGQICVFFHEDGRLYMLQTTESLEEEAEA